MRSIYKRFLLLLVLIWGFSGALSPVLARSGNSAGEEEAPQKTMPQTMPVMDVSGNIVPSYLIDKNNPDYIPAYREFFQVNFYEKWEIVTSRPAGSGEIAPGMQLTNKGFIRFLDGTHIQFRLNESSRVLNGEVEVTPQRLVFDFYKEANCSPCIKRLSISRKSEEAKEYLLEFDGIQQLFTVNRVKIQK